MVELVSIFKGTPLKPDGTTRIAKPQTHTHLQQI